MISNEVLIGLAGLVLSVLTYFAGVQRTKWQLQGSEKEERIKHVMNIYLENLRSGLNSNFDGLMKAGVVTLKDDKEIRELCERIVKHGVGHPFGKNISLLDDVDLHFFFSYAVSKNIDFFRTDLKDIVEKIKVLQKKQGNI